MKRIKAKIEWEFDELKTYISQVLDEVWSEWFKEKADEGFNLHLYRGEDIPKGEGSLIQFNDFSNEFIYCVTLDDVIKSAIECNDGGDDLIAMAKDLERAAGKLKAAAVKTSGAGSSAR